MKQLLPLLIIISCHIIKVSGVLEWTVIGKVTDYGQSVTLFCNVSYCCPKDSGWDRYSPEQQTLFIDVKTGHSNKKYDGKVLRDGYTLVIKNLTKKDLNVSYACVYGVTIGTSIYLLEEDVFTYMSDTTPNLPPDNISLSEIEITGIIIGIMVPVAVAVVVFVVYSCQKRKQSYIDKVERLALMRSEDKETGLKGTFATEDEANSLDKSLEMQNTQTIKDGILETEHNAAERKKHIRDLILHDTCVKHHYSRVMFIGKQNVGKTSLMRRLLGMSKDEVVKTKTTDGIHISKCMINVEDGKWRPCNETDDDLTRLIHRVFTEKTDKTQNIDVNETEANITNTDTETKKDIENIDETKMSDTHSIITTDVAVKAYTETKKDNNESTESKSPQYVVQDDITNKLYEHTNDVSSKIDSGNLQNDILDNDDKLEDDSSSIRSNSTPLSNTELIKEIEDESFENESNNDLNKMTSDIMKHCFTYPDISKPQDPFASCWLWDFAGQNDFYATHQAFMSSCAVYILVADSLEFSETEALWVDFEKSAQYVRFWCDAVHCYSSTMANKEHLDPAIIIVHTKKDRNQDVSTQKIHHSEFVSNIAKVLKKQEQKKHIREIYHVSNTEDEEQYFEKIRNTISTLAMEMKSWGVKIPLKWFLFQQVIEKLKENKVSFSTTLKVQRMAKHDDIGITDDDDFKDCLLYFHNVGTLIYFDEEGLRENIILDPKWLVDAFRCLVSHEISDWVRISDDWDILRKTGKLTETLLHKLLQKQTDYTSDFNANKDHLVEVMKKFDIIVQMKGSLDLYMPCMMEDCSLHEIKNKLFSDKFDKTSWLVLRFDFLPPVFFNHIVAVYMKQYDVSQILDKKDRLQRHALYRKLAVFNIPKSNCKQLIIGQAPSIIAVQIWYSKGEHDQEYSKYRKTLCDIVQSLKSRYKLSISYEIQFTCMNGDFALPQTTWADLKESKYLCLQHENEQRSSAELFNCWYGKDYDYFVQNVRTVLINNQGTQQLVTYHSASGAVTIGAAGDEVRVDCCLMDEDGRTLVTGSTLGPPRVWNMQTGELLRIMKGDTVGSTNLHLACNERLLVGAVHADLEINEFSARKGVTVKKLQIWNFVTGKPLDIGVEETCSALCVMSDPDKVLFGRSDKFGNASSIVVWDLLGNQPIKKMRYDAPVGNNDYINFLASSQNDRYCLAGFTNSFDNYAEFVMFDMTLTSYYINDASILRLDANPECTAILTHEEACTGLRNGDLVIFKLRSGQADRQLLSSGGHAHSKEVKAVSLSQDNKFLVSCSADNTIKLWDLTTEKPVQTMSGHTDEVWCSAISVDNEIIVSGSKDGTIRHWRTKNGSEICAVNTGVDVFNVTVSQDKGTIVALGDKFGARKLIMLQVERIKIHRQTTS